MKTKQTKQTISILTADQASTVVKGKIVADNSPEKEIHRLKEVIKGHEETIKRLDQRNDQIAQELQQVRQNDDRHMMERDNAKKELEHIMEVIRLVSGKGNERGLDAYGRFNPWYR